MTPKQKKIVRICEAHFRVNVTAPNRCKRESWARAVTHWILRNETGMGYKPMSASVGRQDHTTALYGVRKVFCAMLTEKALCDEIRGLQEAASQQGDDLDRWIRLTAYRATVGNGNADGHATG